MSPVEPVTSTFISSLSPRFVEFRNPRPPKTPPPQNTGGRQGGTPRETLLLRDENDVESYFRLSAAQVELGCEAPVSWGFCLEVDVRGTPRVDAGEIGFEPVGSVRGHVLAPPVGVIVSTSPVGLPPFDPSPGKRPAIRDPEEAAPNDQTAARRRSNRRSRDVERSLCIGAGRPARLRCHNASFVRGKSKYQGKNRHQDCPKKK